MSFFGTTTSIYISREEFNLFHSIDRRLYSILVNDLCLDPLESVQIMAFWLWLERTGFRNMVTKILRLPHILIKELADEAMVCLNCINSSRVLYVGELSDIPLTQNLTREKEISLQIFHENQEVATRGIAKVIKEVCVRAFSDIMQLAIRRNAMQKLAEGQMFMSALDQNSLALAQLGFVVPDLVDNNGEVPPDDRTMFVTFSKGYPVAGWEVQEFFNRAFGDCIESLYMQEVNPDEQALFARLVFYAGSTIDLILNGMEKVKFTINGKHVWVRKFVPKRPRATW